jgi:hypothetical protein
MAKVSFTEYYLRHPGKLETLHPEKQKIFWDQRHWHPVVRMRWVDAIASNGEGVLTYPDGSKIFYNGLTG